MLSMREVVNIMANDEKEPLKSRHKFPSKDMAELRRKKIQFLFREMVIHSSFHGMSHIFNKKHPIRRFIWFFIAISALGFSMQKVYESTNHYLGYPFYTARMRRYVDELHFPAVSICNENDIRFSVLNGSRMDEAILNQTSKPNQTSEDYQILKNSSHKIEEMLIGCEFNSIQCTAQNFTPFSNSEGYRCYTFNAGEVIGDVLKISGTGEKRSLKITIDIQHYDYYRDGMSAGVHLIIHGPYETPLKMRGATVRPGASTHVKVEKQKIINLKSPYKTHCDWLELKYFRKYSMQTCWLEQLTDYVVSLCGCKDYFMPGHARVCALEEAKGCMWPKWEFFENNKMESCPLPCQIESYDYSLSSALFPSPAYADALMEGFPQLRNLKKPNTTNHSVLRDTLLRAVVFYDDLSYELLEQKPSYDTLVWLGDVGGQIGLFVGAGVMSYFELLDCLLLIIYTRFFAKRDYLSQTEKIQPKILFKKGSVYV